MDALIDDFRTSSDIIEYLEPRLTFLFHFIGQSRQKSYPKVRESRLESLCVKRSLLGTVQEPLLAITVELIDENSGINNEVDHACVGLQRISRQQPPLV